MGLIESIRAQGVSSRITEEMLYAEALREIEQGVRRDGLWAKALSRTKMNQNEAHALYLELRVQSLKDEIALLAMQQEENVKRAREAQSVAQKKETSATSRITSDSVGKREPSPTGWRHWINVLIGAVFVMAVGIILMNLFTWAKGT